MLAKKARVAHKKFYAITSTVSTVFYASRTKEQSPSIVSRPARARPATRIGGGSSNDAITIASGRWDSRRIRIDCDGYSCALVASSSSIESPRAPPPSRRVDRGLGGQQRRRNGRHTGTVESRSRFDGASGSSAKAIVLIDLVLLT